MRARTRTGLPEVDWPVATVMWFLSFWAIASTAADVDSRSTTVPPKDMREVIDRSDPAYAQLNAIGVVYSDFSPDYVGTGFLVDKPCLVLTNVHTVFEVEAKASDGASVQFSVATNPGGRDPFLFNKLPGTVIAHGHTDGSIAATNEDWALIRLDHSIDASKVAPLKMYQMNTVQLKTLKVETAGFPADRTWKGRSYDLSSLYADMNCRVLGESIDGFLEHNCQSTPGASGSPLLTQSAKGHFYAVGMLSGGTNTGLEKSGDIAVANRAAGFAKDPLYGMYGIESQGSRIRAAIDATTCED